MSIGRSLLKGGMQQGDQRDALGTRKEDDIRDVLEGVWCDRKFTVSAKQLRCMGHVVSVGE